MIKNREGIAGLGLSAICSFLFLFSFLGSSAQYVEILLFFVLLILYFVQRKNVLDRESKLIIFALIGVFVAYGVSFVYSQGLTLELSPLNPYVSYLACACIALFLFSGNVDISKKIIFFSIAVAGIFNGCFALYQAFVLDISRVYGMIGIFKFSQTSGTLCIILGALFILSKDRVQQWIYAIGCLFSLCAVILSVTRGSYVGLLFGILALLFLLIFFGYKKKALVFFIFIGICVGGWCLFFVLNQKNDPFNVEQFQRDLELHNKGIVDTSNGLRIEMWKEAIAIFRISPIFGMHSQLVDKHLDEIISLSKTKRTFNELLLKEEQNPNPLLYPDREKIVRAIVQNRHNQFFDTLSSAGIVGIGALFFLIASFLFVFWRGCKSSESCSVSFAGIGVLFFFGGCSIGDVPFSSNFMVPFMMITLIVLLKLKKQEITNAN